MLSLTMHNFYLKHFLLHSEIRELFKVMQLDEPTTLHIHKTVITNKHFHYFSIVYFMKRTWLKNEGF